MSFLYYEVQIRKYNPEEIEPFEPSDYCYRTVEETMWVFDTYPVPHLWTRNEIIEASGGVNFPMPEATEDDDIIDEEYNTPQYVLSVKVGRAVQGTQQYLNITRVIEEMQEQLAVSREEQVYELQRSINDGLVFTRNMSEGS
jgi:hypothetical protein